MIIYNQIECLIYYANAHLLLDELDSALVRNQILDEVGLEDYIISEVDYNAIEELDCPCDLLEPVIQYAVDKGRIKEEEKEKLSNKIMSILEKKPSEIVDLFTVQHKRNPQKAMQWLYEYAIKSNYINKCKIAHNKHWEAKGTTGKIEVTINILKPEFSIEQIKESSKTEISENKYPLCNICYENEGYAPHNKYNLRTIPITLGGEEWFMQFSPYNYFNQHIVAVNSHHTPMAINKHTLEKLFDFNDYLPHYFIGINSELIGTGGSNLIHEHFQGGYRQLPLILAKERRTFKCESHPLITISEVDWYNTVIRATSLDRHRLVDFGAELIEKWRNYNDAECGLVAKTDEQHHSMSLCVRRDKQDNYVLEVVLRSNLASEEHPTGVFHSHANKHHIKKEAIGLIDSMGVFILPGRIESAMEEIKSYLTKAVKYNPEKLSSDMKQYIPLIDKLFEVQGNQKPTQLEATLNIKDEINVMCEQMLMDTAVFKQDKNGREGLNRFFNHLGLIEKSSHKVD